MYIYGPKDGNEGGWGDVTSVEGLQALIEPCEKRLAVEMRVLTHGMMFRLQILGKHARPPICIGVYEDPPLEEWVTGHLVAVGAACHPLPVKNICHFATCINLGT